MSLLCRAVDATWAVEWEGEPAPAASPDEPVTYLFHVGLNSGTSSHRFVLQLDGRPVVSFDTAGGTENRAWTIEGQDGARLQLLTTRIGGFDERFGFMALTLPRRQLGDGPPRFRIVPEAAGSQDYVLVFEQPRDAVGEGGRGGGRPKGGRRLLTADVSHLGPAIPVVARAAGREVHRGELALGHTRVEIGVPEGVTDSVRVEIEAAGRTLLDRAGGLPPGRDARIPRRSPHSHVDIGYS